MPRTKKAARRGRGRPQAAKASEDRGDDRSDMIERVNMNNERMEAYYKAQSIVPPEEWDTFLSALRDPLPTTFRVAGSRQTAHVLNDTIKTNYVPHLSNAVFEGEKIPPPSQIPWYPDGLAWQFNVGKKVLRKSPEFKRFHSFLVFETEVGNISRQEAVSMLPPLFLDVEPHHHVIDMCAAPGSKTSQLLEAMHAKDTLTASSFPSGLLIANDSDYKRTHLLIHQSARLPSPAIMVTNLDASIYPSITLPAQEQLGSAKFGGVKKQHNQLLFDRILCDVPCSGDGTIRKNPGIWKSWNPMDGNGLHGLQLRILQRAMRMLKEDGRIVYSTCSLNPVENEAVVAAALKSIPGFELMDVNSRFPELMRRPGLTTWTPSVSRNVDLMPTQDDFATFLQSHPALRDKLKPASTLWPPVDAEKIGLRRCLRIYPHIQDTGGFFVAVLQRTATPNIIINSPVAKKETKRPADEEFDTQDTKKPKLEDRETVAAAGSLPTVESELEHNLTISATALGDSEDVTMDDKDIAESSRMSSKHSTNKGKNKGNSSGGPRGAFKESPFTFISPEDPILQSCIQRMSLKETFPASNVLVRNPEGEAVRSLYLTNDIVKTVVQNNDFNRIRLMTCGTKILGKQDPGKDSESQFRVLSEGLPALLPYIDRDAVVTGDIAALKVLVQNYYPLCAAFAEPFRTTIESKALGSHVLCTPAGQLGSVSLTHDLVLPIWKSNTSVSLMIDKKAKSALSLRLYGEDITTAAREAVQQGKKSASHDAAVQLSFANEDEDLDGSAERQIQTTESDNDDEVR